MSLTFPGPWASASLRNCCTSPGVEDYLGCTRHLPRGVSTLTRYAHGGGDDRISGTHADRHDDISHNTIAVVHLTLREWSLAALWQLSRFVIFGQLLITDL